MSWYERAAEARRDALFGCEARGTAKIQELLDGEAASRGVERLLLVSGKKGMKLDKAVCPASQLDAYCAPGSALKMPVVQLKSSATMSPCYDQTQCTVAFTSTPYGLCNPLTTVLHIVIDSGALRLFTIADLQTAKEARGWSQDNVVNILSDAKFRFWKDVTPEELFDALTGVPETMTYSDFACTATPGDAKGEAHGKAFRALAAAAGEGLLALPNAPKGTSLRAVDEDASGVNAALVAPDGTVTRLFLINASTRKRDAGCQIHFTATRNGTRNQPLDADMPFDYALAVLLDADGALGYVWKMSKADLVKRKIAHASAARTDPVAPQPIFHLPSDAADIAERCGVRLIKRVYYTTATYSQWPEHCAFGTQ